MVINDNIQSALDVGKRKDLPRVEPYYNKVYQRVWFDRWMGLVSGLLTGGGTGALIGTAAAFLPSLAGYGAPSLEMVGKSAALFSGVGAFTGVVAGTQVGAISGGIAAGFEEHERREKLEKIREKNPELAEHIEHAITAEADAGKPKSRWEQFTHFLKNSMVWRIIGISALAGAVIGAILAINPVTAPSFMEAANLLFPGAGTTGTVAAVASAAAITGVVGAAFAPLRGGMVTNVVDSATRPIMNGSAFDQRKQQDMAEEKLSAASLEKMEAGLDRYGQNKSFRERLSENRVALQQENTSLPLI